LAWSVARYEMEKELHRIHDIVFHAHTQDSAEIQEKIGVRKCADKACANTSVHSCLCRYAILVNTFTCIHTKWTRRGAVLALARAYLLPRKPWEFLASG
jgi:hypothetical protein